MTTHRHRTGRPDVPAFRASRTRAMASSFALVFAAACGGDATGIDYRPASLLYPEASSVRLRIYDQQGGLAFCGTYPVDESRPPGDTLSLVAAESHVLLAPANGKEGRVRVVAELFDAASAPDCDRIAGATPVQKKVAILRYAEGEVLPLRTTFDFACMFVDGCDESSETCEEGACVSADVTSATGTAGSAPGCFDVASCPNLTVGRATAPACTFDVGADASNGYVAVRYRFDVGAGATTTGAAVLSPKDYVVAGPRSVTLAAPLCALVESGHVTDLWFGHACAPPEPRTAVCANVGASASLARVATDATGPGADAGLDAGRDASTDANVDSGFDATIDATSDAAGDGAADARNDGTVPGDGGDAGSVGDSGDSDDGGIDDGGSTGDGGADPQDGGDGGDDGGLVPVVEIRCGNDSCQGSTPVCCLPSGTCISAGQSCGGIDARVECDDPSDCSASSVCCLFRNSVSGSDTACRTREFCTGNAMVPVCDRLTGVCPPGTGCVQEQNTGFTHRCIPGDGRRVKCGATYCDAPEEQCCADMARCVSAQSSCPANFWRCDDSRDCPDAGDVCCWAGVGLGDKSCMTRAACDGVATRFAESCSEDGPYCKSLSNCISYSGGQEVACLP
ncbi:MAG: hypothetical protein U0169_06400 [Polyangiaceae bacterium]